ncbi:MAG: hypothetical protein JKY19_04990 [Alcanivoracaceae bacterium]|nr:hypothetical protein [Alcanivoracaceae bacterium]
MTSEYGTEQAFVDFNNDGKLAIFLANKVINYQLTTLYYTGFNLIFSSGFE